MLVEYFAFQFMQLGLSITIGKARCQAKYAASHKRYGNNGFDQEVSLLYYNQEVYINETEDDESESESE